MPHQHEGYDIESRRNGEIVRYIEVKSLSGEWTEIGAGVSGPQYRKASELRDRFWLYVVENAQSDPRIYSIRDPVGKAHQFMFDENWKLVADPRQRPLVEIEISSAVSTAPVDGFERIPLIAGDGDVIRALADDDWQGEVVDVAAREVQFVYRDPGERLWPVAEPPHDSERSGRLVLVEFLQGDSAELVIGWYRGFSERGRIAIELTSEPDSSEPIILRPEYEADVVILGEVLGRGSGI